MLAKLKVQDITILISTPCMDEASLCGRVTLMQTGKILSTNIPEQIITDYPTTLYAVKAPDLYTLLQHLYQEPEIDSCYPFDKYLHLTLKETTNPYQFEQQLT